jgi:16S rRNA (cytosine1402-N4)-methyltransferase
MNTSIVERKHVPVLKDRIMELLDIQENDIVVDGTLGLGGHSREMLLNLGPSGKLVGFDLDNRNMQEARKRLRRFQGRVFFVNDSFDKMDHYLKVLKLNKYDKILLDLGLSSPHLDIAEYGFAFKKKGPLDMRFDRNGKVTASVIINNLPEKELADLFRNFGEVPSANKIARFICEERKKKTFVYTTELAERLEPILPQKDRDKRLACIFQALRIGVNDELNTLYRGLRSAFECLSKGGRMAVISYHSLEDRMVKQYMNELLKPEPQSIEESRKRIHGDPLIEVLAKKVITPLKDEIDENPRARSAKLRVFKKL